LGERWSRRLLLSVAGALLAAPPPFARGDQHPPRELLLFDDTIVSAAAKYPQELRRAASAVTVVTREEIRRFGYRTLGEVLRSVRGFYGSNDRNYDYIGVRGFQRPSDYNDRILLLVNGHTYNDDIYQTALVGNEFGIDLEAVERIEIIRGPGSALYGGNALFAVINVVTATGTERPGVRPLVATGSFRRKRGQLSAGHRFDNGLDVFVSGSVLDLDGQRELFYPEYDGPETNNGFTRDADGERALNFFLRAAYGGFVLQGGANRREKHIPTGAFGTTFGDRGTKTVDERPFAELQYATPEFNGLTIVARAFFDRYHYDGTYIYGEGEDRIKNKDLATSDWFGGEIRGHWQAFDRNVLTAGGEYQYHPDVRQKNFNLPDGEVILDDERSYGVWGIYVQDELALHPRLSLVGGARYDRYYNDLDQISPRAGAIWSPAARTAVKLLYGRAFRPPNLFEQYYAYVSEGFVSVSNPDLEPERIATYEAVLEQGLWQGVEAVIALYHYDIDDLIDQVEVESPDPESTAAQYQNVGSARATGAEIELRVPLPRGVTARGTYSIQQARSGDGQLLTNSPKHIGHLAALFPLPLGIQAGAELRLLGPRLTLQRERIGTAAVANLNFLIPTPVPRLGLSAGFYNIFDQRYSDPGAAEHVQDRIEQDGFTFRLQLYYDF
jgi:outer membrane receptor for ferrienterochelin and colicins